MPRTKYHAKLEQERKLKASAINQETTNNQDEVTAIMTTNETNGNGNKAASLNALASAIGIDYVTENPTVEDLLFAERTPNQSLVLLAKMLGADSSNLANLIIADSLEGSGNVSKLLRTIADDLKKEQLNQQKQLIEARKQELLNEMRTLDNSLERLAAGSII